MSGDGLVDNPPMLRVIHDGLRMAGGYGFVDLFPTNPRRKLILAPPDLNAQRSMSPPPAIAFFPCDGTSQFPYVRLRIDSAEPGSRIALADVTLQSFIDAADSLRRQLILMGGIFPNYLPPGNLGPSGTPLGG
jgi:hypothetical protein